MGAPHTPNFKLGPPLHLGIFMPALKLIEAVKTGDIAAIDALLADKGIVEEKDDYGWTALNWAAGKGDPDIIRRLLEANADIANAGRDNRTAYQIALAAAHLESARLLQQAGQRSGIKAAPAYTYCKAYAVEELKRFPDAPLALLALDDGAMVFLHQDFSVTRSMTAGDAALFTDASEAWETFCTHQLGFCTPTDMDWVKAYLANKPQTN